MISVFFTKNHPYIFISLRRFFLHVLNLELSPITNLDNYAIDSIINVLLFEEEKEYTEFLFWIKKNYQYKIIFIGFGKEAKLNLRDFHDLSSNFNKIIYSKTIIETEVFSKEELKIKVSNFFKSHGEESLFEVLNWTRYFLSNGFLLFSQSEITKDEFWENFFIPGNNYWSQFVKRFNKYSYFLEKEGFINEVNGINLLINEFENVLQIFLKPGTNDRIKYTNKEPINNIDQLKKIDNLLTQINKKATT